MMRRTIFGLIVFILTIVGMTTVTNSPLVSASASSSAACSSLEIINSKEGCTSDGVSNKGTKTVNSLIKNVVNTLSLVVGIITVFMIILAGYQFISSGGDSNAVSKARTALFYAMIGLLVIALSQFLVHFVLNTVGA